jgi:hypothetical protein
VEVGGGEKEGRRWGGWGMGHAAVEKGAEKTGAEKTGAEVKGA